jgi:hypothetical protein
VTAEVWRRVKERQKRQEKDRRNRRVESLKERAEKVTEAGRRRGIPHEWPTETKGGKR